MNEEITPALRALNTLDPDQSPGKKKKKDKKKNEPLPDDKTFLAYTRTLLAWIRTSTSLLTFGFAIYKLLQQEAEKPGDHPCFNYSTQK